MTLKKTLSSFIVGIGILFILPLFVFAHTEDADIVSHDESAEVQVVQIEKDESFIGDGHTDHTHAEVSFVVWWQSKAWWTLFLVSLLLMSLLSFGVYKFLEVKK